MPKNTSLALRLLKEREAKLSALRAALVEGEDNGPSTAFDFDRFIARKQDRFFHRQRATSRGQAADGRAAS